MMVHTVHGEAQQDGMRVGMALAVAGWEHMDDVSREIALDHARRMVERSLRADGVTGDIDFRETDHELPDDPDAVDPVDPEDFNDLQAYLEGGPKESDAAALRLDRRALAAGRMSLARFRELHPETKEDGS